MFAFLLFYKIPDASCMQKQKRIFSAPNSESAPFFYRMNSLLYMLFDKIADDIFKYQLTFLTV